MLDDALKAQLKTYLERLVNPITLTATLDESASSHELKALLEKDAPYNANVHFKPEGSSTGWNCNAIDPWLASALNSASTTYFGNELGYIGQGGTIPLMNMLQQGFPKSQHVVCGVLGPKSNAHGPNEFLHVPYAKKLTAAMAQVIAAA